MKAAGEEKHVLHRGFSGPGAQRLSRLAQSRIAAAQGAKHGSAQILSRRIIVSGKDDLDTVAGGKKHKLGTCECVAQLEQAPLELTLGDRKTRDFLNARMAI